MLEKFNNLFNKIIFEQIQNNEQYDKYIQDINTCDAFFRTYIEPLSEKYQIQAIKARYNTFRLFGPIENIYSFFKNFKVDKQFMKDSSKFQILNPMFSLCQNEHKYNKIDNKLNGIGTEGETLNTYITNSIETFNNQKEINKNIFGVWHELFNYNKTKTDSTSKEEQKIATPNQTTKELSKIQKILNITNEQPIYIEFMVNVDKLPNNSFEELAKAVPITNGQITLSDVINNRPDVINPKPNKGVLGTEKLNKIQNITKEANKTVKKNVKRENKNFDKKNKIK